MKYESAFIMFFEKQNIFMTDDARRFLLRLSASEAYIRLMLHNLVQSGKLYRIGKGAYTFQRNEGIIGFRFRPFYYGLQYALTIRKIWTQQSIPVTITRSKAEPGIRELMGIRIIIHRINAKGFFGFEYVNYGGLFVPVSDPEKTLLDFIYYGIELDPETRAELEKRVNKSLLKEYTARPYGRGDKHQPEFH
ncbi:MAG: type IV toxin-antitoxin system AbiEi family antitoxin domain-containing protein [Thermoplasmata archaeon]